MLAAAWTGTIATVVLAAFAIISAIFAIKAHGEQAAEVRVLIAERRREAEQRRRGQAAQVFTWPGEAPLPDAADIRAAAFIRNSSSQPVYDVSIGWAEAAQASVPRLMLARCTASQGRERPLPPALTPSSVTRPEALADNIRR